VSSCVSLGTHEDKVAGDPLPSGASRLVAVGVRGLLYGPAMDDDEPPRHPLLAEITPEQALSLRGSPTQLDAWMQSNKLTRLPPGFFGHIARLAFEAEEARAAAALAAQEAARLSEANRRRKDLDRLRRLEPKRLPPRQREVFVLCIDAGLSIAEAAARLDVKPTTVRTYLKRMREVLKRNEACCQSRKRAAAELQAALVAAAQ